LVIRVFLKSFYLLFKPLVMYGCKINIHEDSRIFIDEGLYLSNKGGILIGAKSLGKNCTIHENVTIGMDRNGKLPTLGDNVTIHRNSLIYGNIKIGDNAVIMEDTVLNRSIPPNIRVSGNPAKLVK
ncbi:MAG: hypothetical protein OEY89_06060, partial [Gammaproteobacteria bacterium]|nr:hypothetical protein [Gammaproteobacteria bacterium]